MVINKNAITQSRVKFIIDEYCDGGLYIRLWDVDECEPFADVTANIPGMSVPEGCAYVKNWSENEGMDRFLLESGIGEQIGTAFTGYVVAPLFRFDMGKVRRFELREEE